MASALNPRQIMGLDESHLLLLPDGHRLQREAADAFAALRSDARQAGFELAIGSSFRSYDRQLVIWNGKASGARPVYDDAGAKVDILALSPLAQMHAILRFSALPGTSRHHWGTDLDVYDASAVAPDYSLQLSLQEVAPGGVFDPLHCWLDARMAAGESYGFYRPYSDDRGGVAPERWHLSYAPASQLCTAQFSAELLLECWECEAASRELLLRSQVEAELPQILARYVAVPQDWCS